MRRLVLGLVVAAVGGVVAVRATTWGASAPACPLRIIYTAPISPALPPQAQIAPWAYFAQTCDVVLAYGSDVQLPPLVGLDPKTVTVRNVGATPIAVVTPSKADVIDGTVFKESGPREPWMAPGLPLVCCGVDHVVLQAQQAVTFVATPDVGNSWFTVGVRQ